VSDPEKPRKRAVARLAEVLPTADDNAHDLVYRDGRLYVTSQSDHRLLVVRIDDQEIVRLAGGAGK
jgi:hypothetical protein